MRHALLHCPLLRDARYLTAIGDRRRWHDRDLAKDMVPDGDFEISPRGQYIAQLMGDITIAATLQDGRLSLEVRVDGLAFGADVDIVEVTPEMLGASRGSAGRWQRDDDAVYAYSVNDPGNIGYGIRDRLSADDLARCDAEALVDDDGTVRIRLVDLVALGRQILLASAATGGGQVGPRRRQNKWLSVVYASSNGQRILAGSNVDGKYGQNPDYDQDYGGGHHLLRSVVVRKLIDGERKKLDIEEIAASIPRTTLCYHLPLSISHLKTLGVTQRGACILARALSFNTRVVRPYDIEIEPVLKEYYNRWLSAYEANISDVRMGSKEEHWHFVREISNCGTVKKMEHEDFW
jgi:hypothetical protein